MRSRQFLAAAMLAGMIGTAFGSAAEDPAVSEPPEPRSHKVPMEGDLPSFEGATQWINSPPLTPAGLRGKVVLVDFWTFTCVNWLRTLPYVRAWAAKYKDKGLVVIGVHTPEFSVEHDIANIRRAAQGMRVDYPIAVDSDYGVWRAFENNYWPAIYIADARGRIRYHHFGEEAYEETERVIQKLLTESGAAGIGSDLVSVDPRGTEVAADWNDLKSAESYVGSEKRENFASPTGAAASRTSIQFLRSCTSTSGGSRESGPSERRSPPRRSRRVESSTGSTYAT